MVRRSSNAGDRGTADPTELLHELRVHQAELEIQNDELRRAQQELQGLHREYADLYEYAPCGYITLDAKGIVTKFNRAAASLLGSEATPLSVCGIMSFLDPASQDVYADARARAAQSGEVTTVELQLRAREGCIRRVRTDINAERNEQGEVVQWRVTLVDVSKLRALEEQYRQAQKMEAVGRLAGGIAHDFNNILGAIIGYCDVILHSLESADPLHGDVESIKTSGLRAAGLTRQLLAFSRKQVQQPRVLDLNAVVSDLRKMLGRLIGDDIEVVLRLAPELGRVRADPGLIEQVIMNLAVNARDAMPQGGTLIIETANSASAADGQRSDDDADTYRTVELTVADTGCGMNDQTKEHLFEPFYTTKEVGRGTGLGLSTVFGIVTQSGGSIHVDSEPGVGAAFTVRLPRVDAEPDRKAAPTAAEDAPGGTERILVAEDEEVLQRLVVRILSTAGYSVTMAPDGGQALLILRDESEKHDLLITDVVMPRMSGARLAAEAQATRPGLRVLFMSGYTDDALGQHGVLEGGTELIQKPFSVAELLVKVRDVLDSPATEVSGPAE